MLILDLFKSLVSKALSIAKTRGLTDELVKRAIPYVKEAAVKFTDNAEKREWVVETLMTTFHVHEGVARIAVQLALELVKKQAAI